MRSDASPTTRATWARALYRERVASGGGEPSASRDERRVIVVRIPDEWPDDVAIADRIGELIAKRPALLEGTTIEPLDEIQLVRDWMAAPIWVVGDDGALREAHESERPQLPAFSRAEAALHEARRFAIEERWERVLDPAGEAAASDALRGEAAHLAIAAELALGRVAEAEKRARDRVREAAEGAPRVRAIGDLIDALLAADRLAEALDEARQLELAALAIWYEDDVRTAKTRITLGLVHLRLGDLEAARDTLLHAELAVRAKGDEATRAMLAHDLGFVLERLGDVAAAEPHLARAVMLREKSPSATVEHARSLAALARVHARLGRDDAEALIARAERAVRATAGPGSIAELEVRWARAWLDAVETPGKAARELHEAAEALRAKAGKDDPRARWMEADRTEILAASDRALDPLFDAVVRDWDDESTHRRFLEACQRAMRPLEPGRRYKELAQKDPRRKLEAKHRARNAVLNAARPSLPPQPSVRPTRRLGWPHVAVAIAFAVSIAWWFLRR